MHKLVRYSQRSMSGCRFANMWKSNVIEIPVLMRCPGCDVWDETAGKPKILPTATHSGNDGHVDGSLSFRPSWSYSNETALFSPVRVNRRT